MEANEILIDHFTDIRLYEDLKTVEAFGGPSAVMRDDYNKGDIYGGLEKDLSRSSSLSAIDIHLEQIEDLIQRIQKGLVQTNRTRQLM